MIPTIIQFYVLILVALISYMLSYLSTHHPLFYLSQIEMFNRKPFSCWLCSNFWLGMFLWVNLAYLWTWWFLVWGFIFTGMTTYIIHHDGY